jgi:hypothetical protein
MDYFQSVVAEYLQRDRASFINTEFLLPHKARPTDEGPPEWLVDILSVNLRDQRVYLCEISYSDRLQALEKRLREWADHWDVVTKTIRMDAHIPDDWPICIHLFVPAKQLIDLGPDYRDSITHLSLPNWRTHFRGNTTDGHANGYLNFFN